MFTWDAIKAWLRCLFGIHTFRIGRGSGGTIKVCQRCGKVEAL